jgi:Cu2+-exporting ATPase
MSTATAPTHETTVLHVGGLHYATQKSVVEHVLGNRPRVLAVEAVARLIAANNAKVEADRRAEWFRSRSTH